MPPNPVAGRNTGHCGVLQTCTEVQGSQQPRPYEHLLRSFCRCGHHARVWRCRGLGRRSAKPVPPKQEGTTCAFGKEGAGKGAHTQQHVHSGCRLSASPTLRTTTPLTAFRHGGREVHLAAPVALQHLPESKKDDAKGVTILALLV